MAVRWGVCSTGKICTDFCIALKTLPESEHRIVAVVSRTKDKGDEFALKFNIPTVYSSYDEFARDSNIDIVYIGSIPSEHFRLCQLMLNAGKNVLCEVPLAYTTKEIKTLNEMAKKKNVFLMEALWSRCIPVYHQIIQSIRNGEIGDVHMMSVTASVLVDFNELPPLSITTSPVVGMLHELGLYTIQFALFIYGEMPVSIKAEGDVLKNGYDADGCIILTFSKGQKASLMYTTKTAMKGNVACIYGTKDCIELRDYFWAPEEVCLPGRKFTNEFPVGPYPCNYPNSTGLRYEAMEVRKCIQNGVTECPVYTHRDSEMVHMIIDEVVKQIGLNLNIS